MAMHGTGGYIGPAGPERRTPEEKRRAAAFVAGGGRIADAARMYGATPRTVARWVASELGGAALADAVSRQEPDMLHEFPAWVRAERLRIGATYRELAARSGVSHGAICNIENGRRGASLATAVAIIDALAELDAGRGA